jgi:drug/metabolite transporter (DMT)-like permease
MNKKALSWFILIALSLVWGSSFILMKQGLVAFCSDEVAGLRISIASIIMFPFLIKHHKIDLKTNLKGLLLMGVFGNLIPAFLFTKAETQISSSLTGMLNALTPMFTIIVGMIAFNQKINKNQFIGVLIGFAGAIALITLGENQNDQTKNVMYCLLVAAATLCYAVSVNAIKAYLGKVNSLTATVWSFSIIGPMAAIYLFCFTDFINHAYSHPEGLRSLTYISILAIFGSAISVVVFNTLIKLSGSIFASSCTYLIPIVAIGWGYFDGEIINLFQILAVIVIIAGIWLINSTAKPTIEKNLTN